MTHDTEEKLSAEEVKGEETSIYIKRNGTQLQLFGQPYTFTGVNAYTIASLNGVNAGCGGQIDNLDALFSTLRPNSVVRFWGWQGSMVTNVKTKLPDWTGIDRVISTAAKYNQRVIISLSDQAGTCDDNRWKDLAWYNGGFMQVYNPNGMTPLSYWDFMQQIVTRYKDSPTIAMWELVNEPEAANCAPGYSGTGCYGHQSCPDTAAAANSLRYFFDTVGGKIKELDPNHLVESGVIGSGQCGGDNWNYQYIHESPGIDVASYHDYGDHDSPMPGDQWNGLQVRLNQMRTIQKPLIIGESGMLAQNNSAACMSFGMRRDKIAAKMSTEFPAGVVGYIPWSWASNNAGVCNYDIPPTDPLMTLLHDFPLLEVTPLPSPTGILTATPTLIPVMTTTSVSPTLTAPTNSPIPTLTPTSIPTATFTPAPTATRIPNTPTPLPTNADTTTPTVSIIFPKATDSITRNTTVTIRAAATDNVAIANVFFFVNNTQLCTIGYAPYNCTWKVPGKKGAMYTIQVRVADTSGNTSTALVNVVVK